MSQKVILKVFSHDERTTRKAIKSISRLKGVESTSMNMTDKKLTLIGDVDPVEVVKNLKKVCSAEILSVGPAKEEKKEEEEPEKEKSKRREREEPKKEEPKKDKEEEEPKKEEPKKDKKDKEEEEHKKEEPKKDKEEEEPKKEEPKKGKRKDEYAEFLKAYEGYNHAAQPHYFVKSRSV